MTFRPSDDVLEEMSDNNWQYGASTNQYYDYNNVWNQWDWQHFFHNADNLDDWALNGSSNSDVNTIEFDIPTEEVKAPDLSELLKNSWGNDINFDDEVENAQKISDSTDVTNSEKLIDEQSDLGNSSSANDDGTQKVSTAESENEILWKLSDQERVEIVSKLEGSVHSNLDLLVDEQWLSVIEEYKKIHRIFFRWWIFILISLIGGVAWAMLQIKVNAWEWLNVIKESSIQVKKDWLEETPVTMLSKLKDNGVDAIVPYGTVKVDWTSFQSRSNLVSYKWIILPQVASIDTESSDLFSEEDFNNQQVSREDLENAINSLITSSMIYRKTANLLSPKDNRRQWQEFQWWLIDWFSLWCLWTVKPTDFVCNKFLDIFNTYGKYYNLSRYEADILSLMKTLKRHHYSTEPICNMIKEYTWRSWYSSSILLSAMENCGDEQYNYYKKMINFIEVENSLSQPELPGKVFDDPDLNAYKLISSQQAVYKYLNWTSTFNKNYVVSYLKYVQALINKDKWTNRYLAPMYKDLLYVFNMDELYQKLLERSELTSDLKMQIDQINNGNALFQDESLLLQLTTQNIIKSTSNFASWSTQKERSLEDVFSQYYTMTDRLKIRKFNKISDTEAIVLTEIYTDTILAATEWETLKATVELSRRDNVLYVDNIRIANQPTLTDILNMYAWNESVTFYAMLAYIDEQVAFWYEIPEENPEDKWNICEEIAKEENVSIYNCDDSSISLYKWNVEYNFKLSEWRLESFTISDRDIDEMIKEMLNSVMIIKDNTPTIIKSIIDFEIETTTEDNIEKKVQIVDQFRIHFKTIPNVYDIEWETDVFLVEFLLWDFDIQAHYNVETHLLTRISYVACDKVLEIRQLSLEISADNEQQLTEILNNPKVFFNQANQAAYRKYLKMCDEEN